NCTSGVTEAQQFTAPSNEAVLRVRLVQQKPLAGAKTGRIENPAKGAGGQPICPLNYVADRGR
ncbi:MAG TPA: hypothetical protein VJQ48_00365, partial [Candidatus Binatia bacterium]|nr:hypothetical protein [Candidatus Binatia bacterium]